MEMSPVFDFLRCRTPAAWLEHAVRHREALLHDHASLELKAAQQAQRIIRKYGAVRARGRHALSDAFRANLMQKMSRLAREELRHFEQVLTLLARRGETYHAVSASRYASGLHAMARKGIPAELVDLLLIGAIIEARSCERFSSLVPLLETEDAELASFYASLLKSEARHFEDYLELANAVDRDDATRRLETLLARDAELILSDDEELRFHSGTPTTDGFVPTARLSES